MPEIRQIRVGGVTYDVVSSEDEVSASRAHASELAAQTYSLNAMSSKDSAAQSANAALQNYYNATQEANRAEDAADRAEAIVGGQFVSYGQDQGLSDTYKAQARKNISAGASNRNLLDNPWWGSGEVVNRRGFTSGSTAHNVYCIDRWKTSYGSAAGTISLGADGLTITAASGTYALINQAIDNYTKLTGKTVTCSAMLSNGTVISGTIANLNWYANPIAVTSGNVRLQMLGLGYFRVTIINGGSATIRAVKLELGSYSTLANDVPPNYAEEEFRSITSTADPTDPYANTGFGRSNRNLLDNPWFTVNQRGQTSYTGRVYGVDRWIEYGSSNTVTVTSDGITLPVDTNSGFEQYFDDKFIQGKTVTISFMLADGTVTSKTVTWPTSGAKMTEYTNGVAFFFGTIVGKNGLAILTNAEVTLRAVKLELGSYSTLANDVPPDYGEELRKCQRYFVRIKGDPIGFGYVSTTLTDGYLNIPTPVQMRAVPSKALNGSFFVRGVGASWNITSFNIYPTLPPCGVTISFALSNAASQVMPTTAYMSGTSYIDFSADL